ncbi:MAG: hypothetical protein ACJAVZ_002215 [Afipia broomeae]|jgi:uncharacterized protein (TIGR00369 family)|uniref:Thioesterase domain-containing protein n=2 Tax=Afipia TaxID=1033 RepID=K8PEL7_9BRAD|nr:PaaI family thioesterase [Afipia broomeae]EKS36783.1 hypothetical protein HMPREF9695_03201 [Afipia broomeae ATCC 49717]RTL77678.1 MAG: PaaI family thioesterase [Bradyrhizobiaceae bacterium]
MTKVNSLKLLDAVMSAPGFPKSSGMHIVHAEPGRVTIALPRKPELLQFAGHFHGGVITALADQAAGAATTTALPEGKIGVTVEIKINFLSPADGDELIARAEVLQAGGTIGVAKVEIFTKDAKSERRCAFGTATMRAVDLPKPMT